MACGGPSREADPGLEADTSEAGRAAARVRAEYRANDMVAAGAWTWFGPAGRIFVLIDAQSTLEGLVQARADLWLVTDSGLLQLARSDVMPAAAEFGAVSFDDLTGDGLPDFFGWVADSAGVSYPVFLPGSRGSMTEEIELAAPGWRFSVDDERAPPQLLAGATRICAIQLWAEEPAPDNGPGGWRWLAIEPGGLGPPRAAPPECT